MKKQKDSQTRHLLREKDGRQLPVSSNGSKGEGRLRDGVVDEKKAANENISETHSFSVNSGLKVAKGRDLAQSSGGR